MNRTAPLVSLRGVSFSVHDKPILHDITLELHPGRTAVILGPNGSGKSVLASLVCGTLEPSAGVRTGPPDGRAPGCVSFELQKAVMEEERREDDSQFMQGALDPGRSVRAFIAGRQSGRQDRAAVGASEADFPKAGAPADRNRGPAGDKRLETLAERFGLTGILERGLRFLSSGEFRKTLICRAFYTGPALLVLDDPFDGLDTGTRETLHRALRELHGTLALVIVTSRTDDVPAYADEVLLLGGGTIAFRGQADEALARYRASAAGAAGSRTAEETGEPTPVQGAGVREPLPAVPERGMPGPAEPRAGFGRPLIEMRSVKVSYYEMPVLREVTWTVREGEHWRISGPNGAGKSTLLDLVNGDNPKAYGQEISLFGRRKGSGETVWEIKKRIGHVSGGFHLGYLVNQKVLGVVLSGFFDSVGLYDRPSPVQIECAERWCRRFGLADHLSMPFGELSFGLQRVALIARAMVKEPELLILDEPCQGLDDLHTEQVLRAAELIARRDGTTLLFVTHDPAHVVSGLTHHLSLVPHPEGGYTARTGTAGEPA